MIIMAIKQPNGTNLEKTVRKLYPELERVEEIGGGTFSKVFKVTREGSLYALKIERKLLGIEELPHILDREKRGITDCVYEFRIQKELSGIEGVPEAVFMYSKNAFLMQYIEGGPLKLAGNQPRSFFEKLKIIAGNINSRGYCLPKDFPYMNNILVDMDNNPWVIDFMLSERLTDKNREDLLEYEKDFINGLEREHSNKP